MPNLLRRLFPKRPLLGAFLVVGIVVETATICRATFIDHHPEAGTWVWSSSNSTATLCRWERDQDYCIANPPNDLGNCDYVENFFPRWKTHPKEVSESCPAFAPYDSTVGPKTERRALESG